MKYSIRMSEDIDSESFSCSCHRLMYLWKAAGHMETVRSADMLSN